MIEVDHPDSLASKRQRLSRLLGHEPDHVTYVEVDFTCDDLDAALAAAGHERSAATLFVWSGVSMYLPGEAVADMLSWVGEHDNPRTSIVFDVIWAEALDGSREYYGAAELRDSIAKKRMSRCGGGCPRIRSKRPSRALASAPSASSARRRGAPPTSDAPTAACTIAPTGSAR